MKYIRIITRHNNGRVQWEYKYYVNKIYVGGYSINFLPSSITLNDLWIEEDYRGKKYSNLFLQDVCKLHIPELFLFVDRNSFVRQLYERYGFEYWGEDSCDKNLIWYKNKL